MIATTTSQALVEIGSQLRSERLAQGMSLKEAATVAESHKPNIVWIEEMKRLPNLLTAARYAFGLGCHLGYFLGGDKEKFKRKRPVAAEKMVETIRSNIAKTMKRQGLGMAEVSEKVGCGAIHVRRILNGERLPSLGMVLKFADALDVHPWELTIAR